MNYKLNRFWARSRRKAKERRLKAKTYLETFNEGLELGEKSTTKEAERYITDMAMRILKIDNVPDIHLYCKNILDVHSSTNEETSKKEAE